MKKTVLAGALVAGGLLAVGNNLVNPRGIEWMGSPDILPKPEGWPATGVMQGLGEGFKVAWKGFQGNLFLILGCLALIALVIFLLQKFRGIPTAVMVKTVLRLGLAALFLLAAWPKFTDPKGFAMLVAQYQFLPAFSVNAFSLYLAAFEVVVGLGIILTPWEAEFSALVGLLMVMFIIGLGQALVRDLGIACGCFDIEGAVNVGESWFSLIRDVFLMPPILWLCMSKGKRFIWQAKNS